MKEFSDTTVTVLLVVALLSAFGGFITILTVIGGDFSLLTGFATTQTAIVNVTIAAPTAITITPSVIEFGSGALTAGAAATPLNTSVQALPSTFAKPSPINVTNDGNTDVNVTINGTLPANWLNSASTYEWAGAATTEAGSCPATNLTTARKPFAAALTRVCANLTYSDGTDSISIHIFLNLSNSLAVGTYTDNSVKIEATACPGPC